MKESNLKNKVKISEAQIQKSFFEWLSHYPEIRKYCFAIPNGGSRNIVEATNLKKQGVTRGVPDVFLAIPTEEYNGLFIEFKSGKNKLTPEQKEMIEILSENKYLCKVVYSLDEAMEIVEDYH